MVLLEAIKIYGNIECSDVEPIRWHARRPQGTRGESEWPGASTRESGQGSIQAMGVFFD